MSKCKNTDDPRDTRITALESMLRELEWSGADDYAFNPMCPICGNNKEHGHSPDCRLKKLLEES